MYIISQSCHLRGVTPTSHTNTHTLTITANFLHFYIIKKLVSCLPNGDQKLSPEGQRFWILTSLSP